MPHKLETAHISFGLVTISVDIYSAIEEQESNGCLGLERYLSYRRIPTTQRTRSKVNGTPSNQRMNAFPIMASLFPAG